MAIVLADAAEVTEATKDVLNAAVESDALWPSHAWQAVAVRALAKGRAAPLCRTLIADQLILMRHTPCLHRQKRLRCFCKCGWQRKREM